uniref:Uncharacterized protein n=1 Tax=Glossina austeni TaxID=7395 RepID=A0A1A9VL46_GLOAU
MLSACFGNSGDNKFSNLVIANVKSEKAQTKRDFKAINEFIIQDHRFWTRVKISASSLASLFNSVLSMMNNTVYLQKQTETLYKQLFNDSRAQLSGWIFLYTDASKISNAVALVVVKDNNDMVEAEAILINHVELSLALRISRPKFSITSALIDGILPSVNLSFPEPRKRVADRPIK